MIIVAQQPILVEKLKFDIVVSHFKENIKWIEKLNHKSINRIFVYTKGEYIPELKSDKIVHFYLPNVGRESHTYIWHFVNNFDPGMSDFTFFLQGSPHGMTPRTIQEWIEACEEFELNFTLNYRISSPYDFLSSGRIKSWAGETTPAECDIKCWCEKYVKKNAEMKGIPIFWNACFGVSSKCLEGVDKATLTTIMQKELGNINPECGHFCERLWFYIFGMDKLYDEGMPEGLWDFWGGPQGTRHYGVIRLMKDGTIGIYDNHNERRWKAEGESIVLFDGEGKKTCIMNKTSEEEYSGNFIGCQKSIHKINRRNKFKK